jgi:hypothetical protein
MDRPLIYAKWHGGEMALPVASIVMQAKDDDAIRPEIS